jgi:sec-independent protein translocase protein TatB
MFGLGFTEILLIAIVALLFIGPDKLPQTMRQIAQGLGKAKRMFDETKSTIENELRVDDLRQEALQYRNTIEEGKKELSSFKNIANKELAEVKESTTSLSEPSRSLYAEPQKAQKTATQADDELSDELFDEADKAFEELEKSSTKVTENSKPENTKQIEPEPSSSAPKVATGFKHLKSEES